MNSLGELERQASVGEVSNLIRSWSYPREKSLVRVRRKILFIPYYAKEFDITAANASASQLVRQLMNITQGVLNVSLSLQGEYPLNQLFTPTQQKTVKFDIYDVRADKVGRLHATSPWELYFQELGDFEPARLEYTLFGRAIKSPENRERLDSEFSRLRFQ